MAIKQFGINTDKFFQTVVIGFILIQGLSWILSLLSPDIPFIKGGWFLFLILVVIVFTTLYTIGKNITQLELKKEGVFILLVFIVVILLFLILPEVIPQIFSSAGREFREFIIESIGNIVRYGGTGVV